jgi:FAD/FMN-containing dehydrogenase
VEGIEAVDGRGESLFADSVRNPDLLWLARGAGAGFPGVVTRYYLKLHPLPTAIRTSTLVYRFADMDPVAQWLGQVAGALPPEVELVCLVVSPPLDGAGSVAAAPAKLIVVSATAFAETEADAQRCLAPIEAGPTGPKPIRRDIQRETPFDALLESIDGAFPARHRYAADVVWSDASPRELLTRMREQARATPSPRSLLLLNLRAPQPASAAPAPTMAFSLSAAAFVGIYGIWADAAHDAENQAWVRETSARLTAVKAGHYVGESDLTISPERAAQCFSAAAWDRIAALRRTYDPEGVFCSYLGPDG